MNILSKEEFLDLANFQSDNCISIYMPTHTSGFAVNEKYDQVVFKNNVQRAKLELQAREIDSREIDAMLNPAFELIKNDEFWNRQRNGLAVFIAKDHFKMLQLPMTVKEKFLLNDTFLVAPLLPAIERRHRFYLLVISKHDCKFFEGDQFEMKKLEIEGLPIGMDDIIPFELKERRQTHRRAGAAAGRGAIVGANFHGHGTGLSDEDEYLLQYFKEVDQTLWTEVLHNQNVPLVLAAVEFEIAHYRQISNYKHIADVSLTGNFEHEDQNSLYLKAKEKLGPYFKEYVNDALENFYNNSTSGLSASTPEEVIAAAHYSQVSDLFVEQDQHIWGSFNEQDNKIIIHKEKKEGDECLINKAIIKTIMNGGEVHCLEREKMPTGSPVAAFLRFPL